MNEPRHPTPYPPPHHPGTHPQAPQIHSSAPRPVVVPGAAPSPVPPPARPGIAAMPTMKPHEEDLDPIELVDEEPMPAAPTGPVAPGQARTAQPAPAAPKKIIAFGADGHRQQHQWKRQLVNTGTGACRVRSFHGKYSEQGLEYLDNAVNEWLDNHPEVEVKFVTSTVMTFEGKIREPALVLNVWY